MKLQCGLGDIQPGNQCGLFYSSWGPAWSHNYKITKTIEQHC